MKKYLIAISCLICFCFSFTVKSQTTIQGHVNCAVTNEPIIFGTVALYKDGVLITGTETDFDGNYFISDIDPGIYNLEITYVGFVDHIIEGVIVKKSEVTKLDIALSHARNINIDCGLCYYLPLIELDFLTSGTTIRFENNKPHYHRNH